ncbi:MAG: TIGR00266 family protein [Candidatus Helarchaeota archaeon]
MPQGKEYEFDIIFQPSFSLLEVRLKNGQELKTEGGTMAYMDPSLEIKVIKAAKGFWGSLKRALAGETFLLNKIIANDDGRIGLAPTYIGDISHIPMEQGDNWVVFSGAFMACSSSINASTKFQGFKKGFFSGERMFFLDLLAEEGPADLFIAASGGFRTFELDKGETIVIDNGHLVAQEKSVRYEIKKIGGLKATIFSGEGLVVKLTGPGKVIMQTRNPSEFISWIDRMLPRRE